MKYYIIAGEASGDKHAAYLVRAIKKRDAEAQFRGWGGDEMKKEGVLLVKHIRDLAFMGLAEVLRNLRTILSNLSFCKRDIALYNPDAVIFVDYPGFNLKIAEFARKRGFRTVYYISPQIWAWHRSRVHSIKKNIDLMLVILPFEKDFYEQYNYAVTYTGHPLLDQLKERPVVSRSGFLKKNGLPRKPLIALLPGSRIQEIKKILGKMAAVSKHFPEYQFVIAGTRSHPKRVYRNGYNIPVVYDQTFDLVANSEAALVTSGTASLETALIGTPEVICYATSFLTYEAAKRVIKVKYISLVNLILDKPAVKELIQHDLTEENIRRELQALLKNPEIRTRQLNDFALLRRKLGNEGASERAAEAVYRFLKDNHSISSL